MSNSNFSRRRFLKTSMAGAVVVVVAGVGAFLALQPQPTPAPVTTPTPPPPTPTPVTPIPTPTPTISPREKMIADAKKEGAVTMYSALDAETVKGILEGFEKAYPGIKTEGVRLPAGQLQTRYLSEYRAGKHVVDIVSGGITWILPALEEGIVASYISPEAAVFPPHFKDAGGLWIGNNLSPQLIGYNTNLVKGGDIPTSYWDLLKARFKNKIGLLDPRTRGHQLLIARNRIIGEARWSEFVKGLSAQNPKILEMAPLVKMLETGEVDVILWGYSGTLSERMMAGAPIDYVRRPKTIISVPSVSWIYKYAPHPNAARLLSDYKASADGQRVVGEMGKYVMVRPGAPQKLGVGIGTGEPVTGDMVEVLWPFTEKDLEAEVKLWDSLFGR